MFWKKKKLLRLAIKNANHESSIILEKKLASISPKTCESLLIDLTSMKGNLTQCIEMSDQIRNFKKLNQSLPIYTFAGETSMGPNILLLLSGDKAFIEKNTMLGVFDFTMRRNLYYKYLMEKKYQIKLVNAGKHKIRLDPFKEFKDADIKWAIDILKKEKEIFLNKVAEIRAGRLKIGRDKLEDFLNSTLMKNEDAISMGLVDGFASLDTFRLENFPNKIKMKDVKVSQLILLKSLKKTGVSPGDFVNGKDLTFTSSINTLIDEINMEFTQHILDNSLKNDEYI